jgi:hypothetical protein
MAVLQKGGVIRHLALQTQPTKPAVGQNEMHRFAKPSLRAACAGSANRRRANTAMRVSELMSLLANPSPETGREHFELTRSGKPANILSPKRRQSEIRTYISGAPPNTVLLRLSGQHGAARGAIR